MISKILTGFIDELGVNVIQTSKRALRRDLGNLTELMMSIEDKGLLHPIVVRPIEKGYEVVAGNRRLEACRRLRWRKIPCHIVELDDKESFEVSLIENIQRSTLDLIEEAEAFRKYVEVYGYGGISRLARNIGKSHSFVSRRISLLKLSPEAIENLVRRRTTLSNTQELISLKEKNADIVGDIIREKHLTTREVRRMIKHYKKEDRKGELSSSLDAPYTYSDIERKIRMRDRNLGKCITSLRITLQRLGDIIQDMDDDFFVKEVLFECRMGISQWMDNLYRLKKKVRHTPSS